MVASLNPGDGKEERRRVKSLYGDPKRLFELSKFKIWALKIRGKENKEKGGMA